jgi:alkylhydroperoxidase family enzyme
MTAIPLVAIPEDIQQRVASKSMRPVNLYAALSNKPDLLRAFLDWAWALREVDRTSRRLRELVILRTAMRYGSPYEWHQHRYMAADAGVTETEVADLAMWRTAPSFDDADRAALALTDAMVDGDVPDEVLAEVDRHFDAEERLELTMTAAFYCGVPRMLDALRVPIEGQEPGA